MLFIWSTLGTNKIGIHFTHGELYRIGSFLETITVVPSLRICTRMWKSSFVVPANVFRRCDGTRLGFFGKVFVWSSLGCKQLLRVFFIAMVAIFEQLL